MEYEYIAYIDEAGDPGISRVRPIDNPGATEWLCLGATLVRREFEPKVVEWTRDIRQSIGVTQRNDLHFRNLSPTRKRAVCIKMSTLPARYFVLASNKKNMRGYHNPRAAKVRSNQWFYNWCVRLLMERITDYCERDSLRRYGEVRKLKVEFSERGGHQYDQTSAYQELLKVQSRAENTFLDKRVPKWKVMDRRLFFAYPHGARAGLQLADVVASAFYTAVDYLDTGPCDPTYAKLLKRLIALEKNSARDYGLCLQPTPPEKANLTKEQMQVFEFYGYRFRKK